MFDSTSDVFLVNFPLFLHIFHRWAHQIKTCEQPGAEKVVDIHCRRVEGNGGTVNLSLGGGFKYFLFSPLFGDDSQFD